MFFGYFLNRFIKNLSHSYGKCYFIHIWLIFNKLMHKNSQKHRKTNFPEINFGTSLLVSTWLLSVHVRTFLLYYSRSIIDTLHLLALSFLSSAISTFIVVDFHAKKSISGGSLAWNHEIILKLFKTMSSAGCDDEEWKVMTNSSFIFVVYWNNPN